MEIGVEKMGVWVSFFGNWLVRRGNIFVAEQFPNRKSAPESGILFSFAHV